jgi:hypothetical protein
VGENEPDEPMPDPEIVSLMADLRGPALPFLVWRKIRAVLPHADPGGDIFGWLSDNDYPLDPTKIGPAIVGLRRRRLDWWAGSYVLQADDGKSHRLSITSAGQARFDGLPVKDAKFANGTLSFSSDEPKCAAEVRFSDPVDDLAGALTGKDPAGLERVLDGINDLAKRIAANDVPRTQCKGTLTDAGGKTITLAGRQGTYTRLGLAADATGDPPDTWNGIYSVYRADNSGAYAAYPLRLTMAVGPGPGPKIKALKTGSKALSFETGIDESSVTYTATTNQFTWAPTDSNSIQFFKDPAGVPHFSGKMTFGGTSANAIGNLERVLPGPAFEIATATLPDAIAKSPYAAQLSADAPGAVDWQISNLPPGLSSKGDTISGTPASSGVSAVNIQIKAGNLTASKTLPLTVGAADYGSASVDWSIVSAIAGIVGGIIVPAILFSIAQHMEKKSQGDSDKNLREVINKVDNAAKRISDAINDSQSAAATDRAALTADTGTLAEDLKKRHEALSKTTDALEARQKKLEDEAKRLGEELRDREKELQKLRDEIAQAEDQAKKETLEKEEAAASEAIRKVAEAHEAVERAAEANGERKDDAEHRERSDGRAAEIAK